MPLLVDLTNVRSLVFLGLLVNLSFRVLGRDLHGQEPKYRFPSRFLKYGIVWMMFLGFRLWRRSLRSVKYRFHHPLSPMDAIIIAQKGDHVAEHLRIASVEKGYNFEIVHPVEASRILTTFVSRGRSQVAPQVPMFLRPFEISQERSNRECAFAIDEALAALYSAAALTRATVINRPTNNGYLSPVFLSSVVTELRLGIPVENKEIFARHVHRPALFDNTLTYSVRDEHIGSVADGSLPVTTAGPFRTRIERAYDRLEAFIVLGSDSWACSDASAQHSDLANDSVRCIARSGLVFGTVFWAVRDNPYNARFAGLDPFPHWDYMRFVWARLGPCLVEYLIHGVCNRP